MPTKEAPIVRAAGRRLPKGERGGIERLLIHYVEHLGKQGDVVEVKRGYASNYLRPQGLATIATEHHKRMVEKHRAKLEEIARERLAGLRSQLAELVRARINPDLPLIEKPLPADDPLQRQPVIDLAIRELGWQPTVALEQGLEPTIAWFRQLLTNSPQG